MSTSTVNSASLSATAQRPLQSVGHHKHGHHSHSLSDIDAQGSSIASAPSSSGKIGSKVNVTA